MAGTDVEIETFRARGKLRHTTGTVPATVVPGQTGKHPERAQVPPWRGAKS